MYAKATRAAANATAPSTDGKYFHAWRKFKVWCDTNGFDLFRVTDQKDAVYLSTRAEVMASPNVLEGEYYAIKAIRAQNGFPLELTPFLTAVRKGFEKTSYPGDLIGFNPEQVQALFAGGPHKQQSL